MENIYFRCLLVSFGILCFWASGILFADALILSIHGKLLGIGKSDLGRFKYDAKMIHYQFLGYFELVRYCCFSSHSWFCVFPGGSDWGRLAKRLANREWLSIYSRLQFRI